MWSFFERENKKCRKISGIGKHSLHFFMSLGYEASGCGIASKMSAAAPGDSYRLFDRRSIEKTVSLPFGGIIKAK